MGFRALDMQLEREMVKIPSKSFATLEKGKAHEIINPVTGATHTFSHGPMATSVGIIGLRPKTEDGEDYYHPDGTVAKLRVCCSSMYFEKPEKIEWKLTFKEKRVPDIQVKLI